MRIWPGENVSLVRVAVGQRVHVDQQSRRRPEIKGIVFLWFSSYDRFKKLNVKQNLRVNMDYRSRVYLSAEVQNDLHVWLWLVRSIARSCILILQRIYHALIQRLGCLSQEDVVVQEFGSYESEESDERSLKRGFGKSKILFLIRLPQFKNFTYFTQHETFQLEYRHNVVGLKCLHCQLKNLWQS